MRARAEKVSRLEQPHVPPGQWVVYLLRLSDDSLYCGCTNRFRERMEAHEAGTGSRLVRARRPFFIAYVETIAENNRSAAQKREAAIKKLGKREKETLIDS